MTFASQVVLKIGQMIRPFGYAAKLTNQYCLTVLCGYR